MRTTSRLTASSLLLTLLACSALGVACEDSGSSSGSFPNPTLDAGGTGDTGGPLPPPPPPPPPPGTGVTVTVLNGTKPVADARVFFHDAAGAIAAEHKTDATGKVTAATAPQQLTVLVANQSAIPLPFPGGAGAGNLVTYVGLAEGDNLVVDASMFGAEGPGAPAPVGKWSVTVPGQAPGATFYGVMATRNCENGTSDVPPPTTVDVDLYPFCLGASNAILATAHDDNNVLAFAWKKGIAPPSAGQTSAVTLDPPWAPPSTFNLKATNVPANGDPDGLLFLIADGASFAMRANKTGSVDSVGGMTAPVPAAGFATSIQATAYAELDRGSPEFATVAVSKREPPGASMTIDLAQALPRLTNVSSSLPTPRRPEATWSSVAPLTGADGGYVRLQWAVRINPDEFVSYTWTFVVPPNATSVKAPALPADLTFLSGDSFGVQGIAFADSSLLPGYKELKSLPVSAFDRGSGFDVGKPLPSDATVRLTIAREDVDANAL